MSQIIEHIDKIARDKKRDVLFICFDKDEYPSYDYENFKIRDKIIEWLYINQISFEKCANYASEYSWERYRGQLYLDVPIDETKKEYQKVISFFENKDGSMKLKGVTLYYLSLEEALKNAHHDEAGFWDNWAENF